MRTSIPLQNTAAQPTPALRRSEAASGVIALNWPLLILIFALPLQNIYLGKLPNLGAGINFINVMLLAAFVVWKTRPELSAPSDTLMHRPLYAYMAILAVSALYGIAFLGELGQEHLHILKDQLTPMFLFFIVLNSVRDRRAVIAVLIGTCLPLPYMFRVFYSQYASVSSWHYDDDVRLVNGTFMTLGSNEIAAFYAAYTLILIALLYYVKHSKARLALLLLVPTSLYCLMYSHSRGSWIAFVAGGAVLAWYTSKKLAVVLAMAALLLGGPALHLLPVSVQERVESIVVDEHEKRDASAELRFVIWSIAMREYQKSPIFGIGLHSFHHVNPYQGRDAHSYFVRVLTEQGAVGILLLALVFSRSACIARRLARSAADPLFKALGAGMLGVIAAVVAGNFFGDRFSHYPLSSYYWVYLALTARALQICQAQAAGTQQDRRVTP
ncbi:MAG: O-antigen ligase family protein [Gammaproteobacteria bacterium]